MELHIFKDTGEDGEVTYRAECGRFFTRIEEPERHPVSDPDDIAVGKIIRSKWMDMIFKQYGRVRVIVHF